MSGRGAVCAGRPHPSQGWGPGAEVAVEQERACQAALSAQRWLPPQLQRATRRYWDDYLSPLLFPRMAGETSIYLLSPLSPTQSPNSSSMLLFSCLFHHLELHYESRSPVCPSMNHLEITAVTQGPLIGAEGNTSFS